jgi:hypothetical protein
MSNLLSASAIICRRPASVSVVNKRFESIFAPRPECIGMSDQVTKQIELEIAHILFIDTVGYSKLSINEQRVVVNELTEVVAIRSNIKRPKPPIA